MSQLLTSERAEPSSGNVKNLVVLLHGFGANGADLIGLATELGPGLPNTLFLAPDAPQTIEQYPEGRQWFPLEAAGPFTRMEVVHETVKSFNILDRYLDAEIEAAGVPDSRVVLVGFSQGTMVALHVAPRRPRQLAGIVGFSGKLLYHSLLKDEVKSRPPVLLIHGEKDELLPHSGSVDGAEKLRDHGFDARCFTSPNLGHSIDMFGLGMALHFIATQLDAE